MRTNWEGKVKRKNHILKAVKFLEQRRKDWDKRNTILQKRNSNHRKMAKMFFEFMHEKTNLLEKLTTKNELWKKREDSKFFLKLLSKYKTTIFVKRPKMNVDTRKSRKATSRNAKNQKKTWNRQWIRTTQGGNNKRLNTEEGRFLKKRHNFISKIDHRKCWPFFCRQKEKTDTELKKKGSRTSKRRRVRSRTKEKKRMS